MQVIFSLLFGTFHIYEKLQNLVRRVVCFGESYLSLGFFI